MAASLQAPVPANKMDDSNPFYPTPLSRSISQDSRASMTLAETLQDDQFASHVKQLFGAPREVSAMPLADDNKIFAGNPAIPTAPRLEDIHAGRDHNETADHEARVWHLPCHLNVQQMDRIMERVAEGLDADDLQAAGFWPAECKRIVLPRFVARNSELWCDPEKRVVSPHDLVARLRGFVAYSIPGTKGETGLNTVQTTLFNTREPWMHMKLLAWTGRLSGFQSEGEIWLAIRDDFFEGRWCTLLPKPACLETAPEGRKTSSKKQAPPKSSAPPTVETTSPRNPQAAGMDLTPREAEILASVRATVTPTPRPEEERPSPTRQSGKRKRADADALEGKRSKKTCTAKKASTRSPFTAKEHSPKETFGRHIKLTFNARSEGKRDYESFSDAVLPDNHPGLILPELDCKDPLDPSKQSQSLGDVPTCLHPQEVRLCNRVGMAYNEYQCQKARFFLGLAIWTEHNRQAIEDGNPKLVFTVGKSTAQYFGNIDVNKISAMYEHFEAWGWVSDMMVKDDNNNPKVSDDYLNRFPTTHRQKLMNEVAAFEADPEKAIPLEKRYAKFQPGEYKD